MPSAEQLVRPKGQPALIRRWRGAIGIGMIAIALAAGYRAIHHPLHGGLPPLPRAFTAAMPQRVLWAWEEPEDLRTLGPATGVAYLAETIVIGDQFSIVPRHQPLRTSANAPVMAVVRMETRSGFHDDAALRAGLAAHLATLAAQLPVRALQIDFDATASQRDFYAAVLRALRPQLPQRMPLSITALVSWCGPDSWLHPLPIDEAVPMYFRMGGPRSSVSTASRSSDAVTEPHCRTSVGLSTDEPWPHSLTQANTPSRVYLFAPAPWQPQQLAAVTAAPLPILRQELVR